MRELLLLALIGWTALAGFAEEPPAIEPIAPTTAEANKALAGFLRTELLKHLPTPLSQSNRNWGHQKEVVVGLKFERLKPRVQKSLRNEGLWHRLTIEPIDPKKSLQLGILDVQSPEAGRTTFTAMLGMDVRATAEQQLWKSGVRLYGGETRARCRAALKLDCELSNRLDRQVGQLIPDALIRVRVTKAEVFYQDLIVERTAGMEGEQARRVGEIAQSLIKLFKPELERELLAKANTAIVKAGDTKEIRVEFQKLLGLVKPE